jgi:hypothetical protein
LPDHGIDFKHPKTGKPMTPILGFKVHGAKDFVGIFYGTEERDTSGLGTITASSNGEARWELL